MHACMCATYAVRWKWRKNIWTVSPSKNPTLDTLSWRNKLWLFFSPSTPSVPSERSRLLEFQRQHRFRDINFHVTLLRLKNQDCRLMWFCDVNRVLLKAKKSHVDKFMLRQKYVVEMQCRCIEYGHNFNTFCCINDIIKRVLPFFRLF